jgi:hypothetical protein
MNPTLVLVALGYTEALEAAVTGDPALVPEPAEFRTGYTRVLSALRANFAEVIATTVPDPLDTAYFSTVSGAAALTGIPAAEIISRYGLAASDLLAVPALSAIAVEAPALPPGAFLTSAAAAQISARVRALNTEIASAAQREGAMLYDLHGLFARVRALGVAAGDHHLSAAYMGGFYSLSGSYPGTTGHAVIANEILALLNQRFRTSFSPVNLAAIAGSDPAVRFRPTEFIGGQE